MNENRLAARIPKEEVAEILGFEPHDIPVLVAARLLKPLGKPEPSSVKYFARCEIERLAADPAWLGKATQVLYVHWRARNAKRKLKEPSTEMQTAESI